MSFRIKVSLAILAVLVVCVAVVPLVVPIPPPEGVRPLAQVAGPGAEYVSVAGVDLHVRRWDGPADGPSFLLVHGFPYSSRTFDDLAPLLAQVGDVVAVDLPGFGLSERPDPTDPDLTIDPYAPASQAELVAGVVSELGLGGAVLLGHGNGARVALETALEHPRLVDGVVTVGASPYVVQRRSALSRLIMRTPQVRAGWHDPAGVTQERVDAFLEPFTVEGWDVALWHLSQAEAPASLEGRLGSLSAPVLVVAGAEDGVVPVDQSERLARDLGDARLELIEGCGHAVQEECAPDLAAAIVEWLTE
jgi:pimeloyl-ACP methyl ester carboxylesterase